MKYRQSKIQILFILIILTTIGIRPCPLHAINTNRQHTLSKHQSKRLIRQQKRIDKRLYRIAKKKEKGNSKLPLLAVFSLILFFVIGIITTSLSVSIPIGFLFFSISCIIGYLLSRKSTKASERKLGKSLLIAAIVVNLLGIALFGYLSLFDFD